MVKYKKKKDKYKIVARNVRANRHLTEKLKVKKFPIERAFLRDYLQEALEVKWNDEGTQIVKLKLDDKKIDLDKLRKNAKIKLEEIKQNSPAEIQPIARP